MRKDDIENDLDSESVSLELEISIRELRSWRPPDWVKNKGFILKACALDGDYHTKTYANSAIEATTKTILDSLNPLFSDIAIVLDKVEGKEAKDILVKLCDMMGSECPVIHPFSYFRDHPFPIGEPRKEQP